MESEHASERAKAINNCSIGGCKEGSRSATDSRLVWRETKAGNYTTIFFPTIIITTSALNAPTGDGSAFA